MPEFGGVEATVIRRGSFMKAGPLEVSDLACKTAIGKDTRVFHMVWGSDVMASLPDYAARIYARFILDNLEPAEKDVWAKLVRHCRKFVDEQRITDSSDAWNSRGAEVNAFLEGICDIIGYAKPAEEAGDQ